MKRLFKEVWQRNRILPLQHQILNEVLLILGILGIAAGLFNLIVDLPLWLSFLFFGVSGIPFVLFFLNHYKGWFTASKIIILVLLYFMCTIGWFNNDGINGSVVFFFITAIIFSGGLNRSLNWLLFGLNFLIFSSLVIICYLHPELIVWKYPHERDHVIDMITGYFLMGLSIILVFHTVLQNYNRANSIAEEQKEKLRLVNAELTKTNELLALKNENLKQKNNQINKQAQELEELLNTRDKLFAIIAHDLRSPFNSILGLSKLLTETLKESNQETPLKFGEYIQTASKQALNLLNNLLAWAKTQTGQIEFKPVKLSLSLVVQEIIEVQELSAKIKDISLNYSQTENITVYADPDMLKIILQNLVSNAIKFTNDGGKVDIIANRNLKDVEICVSDNGIGIDAETLPKLFIIEINSSTLGTANEKGSGLGLVLCKEFVEMQGGKIIVESEPGKGSSFKFTLPY